MSLSGPSVPATKVVVAIPSALQKDDPLFARMRLPQVESARETTLRVIIKFGGRLCLPCL